MSPWLQLGAGAQPLNFAVRDRMECSEAQASIDALVRQFFSAFDNRDGVRPQIANLTDCFAEKATIARHSHTAAQLYTVVEFAAPRILLLTQGTLLDFHEWEVSSTTQVFNGVAARVSRYRKSGLLDGEDYSGSGTKCFHLVNMDVGWRISSLAWVDDDEVA